MKKKLGFKIFLLLVLAGLVIMFFLFDLDRYFSFGTLKNELGTLQLFNETHPVLAIVVYMAIYIIMAAVSFPGATVVTLAGGAVFGLFKGLILASFASTIGATFAFLFSRYLLRQWVQEKFSAKISSINSGMEKEGGFYLFTLRLLPIFPFFVINLAMGVTSMPTFVFYSVSQLGMLPGAFVYVNAGTQLAAIGSPSEILSFKIIFSFALLGIFPFIAKKIIGIIRSRRIFSRFTKPKRFDYNVVVIGGGAAGLVASYVAAAVRSKVALIEQKKLGGDCLNTGCVPSKALIASAKLISMVKRADSFGFKNVCVEHDFLAVMERVQQVIKQVEPHDSVERYTRLGVDCFQGRAGIISPFEVAVGEKRITAKNIIIATGARPMVPDLPGLDQINYYTSDTIWDLRELPERLVILGGGPIGCELAQAFSRLGAHVILVQRGGQLMKKEDPDASELILKRFKDEGIEVLLHHGAKSVRLSGEERLLICTKGENEVSIGFDEILIALGRVPNVEGFGLEALGVETGRGRHIETNEFLQTNYPNIYCSGDVHGRYQFTHTAAHESWYASVNALFGMFRRFKVDYRVIPWATYTDPEVARVGLNESDAVRDNIPHEVVKYGIDDLDRAITDSEDFGFVKVLTVPGKDKILGVTIVGNHAADIIAEFVLAMKHGIGLNKILGTIHIYPTMAEANKYAAGMWKKQHAPEKILGWLGRYHAWMRKL